MSARAQFQTADSTAYDVFIAEGGYASEAFFPGERLGSPRQSSARKAILRTSLLILIGLGGYWMVRGDGAAWLAWASTKAADVIAMAKTGPAANSVPPAVPEPAPLPPQQLVANEIATAPGEVASPPAPPQSEAAAAPAVTIEDAPAVTPLPPPVINPGDAYQKRASAVGLHPDLSRVLLKRLSAADYRNAGVAIKTALAETADSEVFTWPRQHKPDLALFEVHFVAGAPKDCRRYVVTVTKDGWLTTALPMEKCK